jgi:ketosteroid isomerase-like protein
MTTMTETLPPAVERYFAAKLDEDIDTVMLSFAEDALVQDEKHTYRGRPAIRAWIEETTAKYHARAAVSDVEANGDKLRVAALVSGNFPGSPVTLHYDFMLRDGLIAELSIG